MTEEQQKWAQEKALLPFDEWMDLFRKLKAQKKFSAISAVAKIRLQNKGFVDLGTGSVWKWMEKDWFERACKEGAIQYEPAYPDKDYEGNPIKGRYIATYEEKEEKVEKERRGNRIIYETVKVKDYSTFIRFYKAYEEYVANKPKKVVPLTSEEIREALQF